MELLALTLYILEVGNVRCDVMLSVRLLVYLFIVRVVAVVVVQQSVPLFVC
ncbi:hypothetical protein SAMD00019534_099480 [Acytostelium subglobosum LB1]|uniref:hypothetical protein n=1 Tax=Acytostelium subglobosum LB1 TaxID=1410327 RepID=UPI000644E4F6|nr:hypothetical protein SAMD00019534_099480 [Acytostelium subglobosum LB1]GAM26773.1 hypothetical protein SAMD00019534_099480 [Acytostelium subglobosum LB1]|eukprot:XP_012750434.1 hypothetical protein SAMD00019534_099480 [Acytostelium subglobosum LB1]